MDYITLLLIAISLSFDTFAISISCGLVVKEIRFLQAFFIAFIFAFVQGVMPLIGWLLGFSVESMVASYDHWIAFVLLTFIGGKMFYEGLHRDESNASTVTSIDARKIWGMAVATSIDALIVGISFALIGMGRMQVAIAAIIVAFVTGVASMFGMLVGKHTGSKFGKRAELAGGIMLVLIGFKVLLEHTMFE